MKGRSGGVVLAVCLGLALAAPQSGCRPSGDAVTPPQAPPFELESLNGDSHSLEDFAGRVVVIDFWATWCAPCLDQIPILNAFAAEHAGAIEVLGVSVDAEGRSAVEDFVKTNPFDYPVLLGDEALARSYGAPGFPALAVVDAQGRIDSLHVGVISPEALQEAVLAASL